MTKIYLLGGEDVLKRDSKEINKKAFIDAGGAPAVLIFPWTAKSTESDKYRTIMADYFKELGASKIEFAEPSDSQEEIAEKIKRSDLIYLPGGDTRALVERIRNAKVDSLLRKYSKVIIGNSAGALALCRNCILTKGKHRPETTIISGFGLLDFSVDVHYDSSKDEELEKLSKLLRIYAIPENCALVYDNGNLSFMGNVYLFYNGERTKCSAQTECM